MKALASRLLRRIVGQTERAATVSTNTRYADVSDEDMRRINAVSPFTMTGIERRYHLLEAVRYVARHRVPGAMVECGVWRGGSMMLVASTLIEHNVRDRDLFLFDTFEGMPPPGADDIHPSGRSAMEMMERERATMDRSHIWAIAGEDDVRENMAATQYPRDKLHFIRGLVEETLPRSAPDEIALLRLDTDWYESTKHELVSLYPRISSGGIIIIDDYGWWKGARKAVDEFLVECTDRLFLHRIDSEGRCIVKP